MAQLRRLTPGIVTRLFSIATGDPSREARTNEHRGQRGRPFGRYRLLDLLGEGGMGQVWRADDTLLGRHVALKRLRPEALKGVAQARFMREASVTAGLRHDSIVAVHDVGVHEGVPYYTMDLIDGRSLAASPPEDPREAARTLAQVARALHFAHASGLVHREVKPSNVLVTSEGRPVLVDFGLARARARARRI